MLYNCLFLPLKFWKNMLNFWGIEKFWNYCNVHLRADAMAHLKYWFRISSILEKPRIIQKQTIPHLKGLIVGFLDPEDWGRVILIGLLRPLFMINWPFRRRGRGKPMMLTRPCPSGLFLSTIRAFKWDIVCLCTIFTFPLNWVQSWKS